MRLPNQTVSTIPLAFYLFYLLHLVTSVFISKKNQLVLNSNLVVNGNLTVTGSIDVSVFTDMIEDLDSTNNEIESVETKHRLLQRDVLVPWDVGLPSTGFAHRFLFSNPHEEEFVLYHHLPRDSRALERVDVGANSFSSYGSTTYSASTQRQYCHLNDGIIYFGGDDESGKSSDIYFLSWNTMTWDSTTFSGISGAPSERVRSAVGCDAKNNRFLLAGGENSGALSDFHVFNKGIDGPSSSWQSGQNLSPIQEAAGLFYRFESSSTSYFAVAYGFAGSPSSTIQLLIIPDGNDITTRTWGTASVSGDTISGRRNFAAIDYQNLLYIHAGKDSGDLNELVKLELFDDGSIVAKKIPPRSGFTPRANFGGSCAIKHGVIFCVLRNNSDGIAALI